MVEPGNGLLQNMGRKQATLKLSGCALPQIRGFTDCLYFLYNSLQLQGKQPYNNLV